MIFILFTQFLIRYNLYIFLIFVHSVSVQTDPVIVILCTQCVCSNRPSNCYSLYSVSAQTDPIIVILCTQCVCSNRPNNCYSFIHSVYVKTDPLIFILCTQCVCLNILPLLFFCIFQWNCNKWIFFSINLDCYSLVTITQSVQDYSGLSTIRYLLTINTKSLISTEKKIELQPSGPSGHDIFIV